MKTLYLHIGTPKTATSSIQQFLSRNRSVLRSHGFCYPKSIMKYPNVKSNRNAHFLIGRLYCEDGTRDLEEERHAYSAGMEQFHACLKECDNVILSDESLWKASTYLNQNLFEDLQHDAEQYHYQIKIIVYLRRQDQFLISRWNQFVKSRVQETLTFQDHLNEVLRKEKLILDYAGKLKKMTAIFGKENLIVRRFDPESWVNGSILHDFMDCVGLPLTADFIIPKNPVNLGLKGNTVEIKRSINQNHQLSAEDNSYLTHVLLAMSEDSESRYPCNMLSPAEIQSLLQLFQDGNDCVATEYIQDGKPLFDYTIKDLPKWEPQNSYMQEDLIQFFSTLAAQLHKENEALRQELISTQRGLEELRNKLKHPFRTVKKRLRK